MVLLCIFIVKVLWCVEALLRVKTQKSQEVKEVVVSLLKALEVAGCPCGLVCVLGVSATASRHCCTTLAVLRRWLCAAECCGKCVGAVASWLLESLLTEL
jgi:bacterioferritin-associated ferredoxin